MSPGRLIQAWAGIMIALTIAMGLSACGGTDDYSPDGYPDEHEPTVRGDDLGSDVRVITVTVEGREIPCVIVSGYLESSISCDWAKPEAPAE